MQSFVSAPPSSSQTITRLIVGLVVIGLLVVAIAATALYRTRDLYRDRALTATQNMAQLIERDFTAALDKVDLAVLSVKDEVESELARGGIDTKRLSELIAAQFAHQSILDSLRITRADGSIDLGAPYIPGPTVNIADREYFIRAREDKESGLVISKPVVGRINGKWTIVAARRINRPDGRFAGIAYASILAEQFEKTLAALDLGPYGAVTLRNQDLQLIARYSKQASSPSPVGNSTVSKELQEAVRTSPGFGTYVAATNLDKIERANTYRRMAKYPFYVLVGLATSDYLSIWREEAVKTAALVTVFVAVIALLTWMIAAAWRRREADAQRILELSRTALRKSEDQLQHALESAEMGVWSLDPGTKQFEADAQARLLYGLPPRGELTSESAFASIATEDVERALAARDEAIRSGRPYDIEIRVLSPDNTRRWIYLRGRREQVSNGHPGRLVGLVQDITRRKEAEEKISASQEKLEAANKELEAFAYSVSHDLRAPLRGMDAFSRILLEKHSSVLVDDARHCLQMIRDNALQAGRLIDDLLAFSRLSQQPLKKAPVRHEDLVRFALKELQAEQVNRQVDVTIGTLPEAEGDPQLLKQVWLNLIGNALKYTRSKERAEIRIGSKDLEGEPVYYVKDNGVGFDMRYAHKLFNVFQRLHRAEDYEGTGVGLAIVHRIVTRHSGRIWAQAAKNEGATFYFTLDGARDHAQR